MSRSNEKLWFYNHETSTTIPVSENEAEEIGAKHEAADNSFLLRASNIETADQLAKDWSSVVQDKTYPPSDGFAILEAEGRYTFVTRYVA